MAAFESSAGHQGREDLAQWPRPPFQGIPHDLRGSAEFAAPPDDGAIQQAAIGQVRKQCGHALVHLRQFPPHGLEMLFVRIPAFVVDGDEGHAFFDQPPCHQARLSERVAAVAVSEFVFLLARSNSLPASPRIRS